MFAEELAVGASPVEVTLAQEGSGNPQAQSQAQVRAIIFEGCQLVQGRLVVFSCGDEVRDFGCSIAGLESGIDLGQDFGLVVFGLGGAAVQHGAHGEDQTEDGQDESGPEKIVLTFAHQSLELQVVSVDPTNPLTLHLYIVRKGCRQAMIPLTSFNTTGGEFFLDRTHPVVVWGVASLQGHRILR